MLPRSSQALLITTLLAVLTPAAVGQRIRPEQSRRPIPGEHVISQIEIDEQVLDLVRRLGSESFSDREAATRELETLRVDHIQLYAVLQERELSAEQRHRLLGVVRHRLINAPRGAIGIRMNWFAATPKMPAHVTVEALLPDLPAERVLRIKDRILAVDGIPLANRNSLVDSVQSLAPGEPVRLSIMRARRDEAGRIVRDEAGDQQFDSFNVVVPLGSADKLRPTRPEAESNVARALHEEAREIWNRYGGKRMRINIAEGFRGSFDEAIPSATPRRVPGAVTNGD